MGIEPNTNGRNKALVATSWFNWSQIGVNPCFSPCSGQILLAWNVRLGASQTTAALCCRLHAWTNSRRFKVGSALMDLPTSS